MATISVTPSLSEAGLFSIDAEFYVYAYEFDGDQNLDDFTWSATVDGQLVGNGYEPNSPVVIQDIISFEITSSVHTLRIAAESQAKGWDWLVWNALVYDRTDTDVTQTLMVDANATNADFFYGGSAGDTVSLGQKDDFIDGGAGDDWLDGGSGGDTMLGGIGSDTYVVDSSDDRVREEISDPAGHDIVRASVSFNLAGAEVVGDVEDLVLTGTFNINGTGNSLANHITGNSGNNIINGSAGVDTMIGLAGNDRYYVDNASDIIVEGYGPGSLDRVLTSVSYALTPGVQVEEFFTTSAAGTGAINLTGNAFAQLIVGNAGANILNGDGGIDTLRGLAGNDSYYVDSATDIVQETAGQGTDLVLSSVSYALGAGVSVEQLITTNAAGTLNVALTGNEVAQTIVGNAGNNLLNGKGGIDILRGLGEKDYFVFDTPLGVGNIDIVADFAIEDQINLDNSVFAGLADGWLTGSAFRIGAAAADAFDRIIYNSVTGQLYFDADGSGGGAAIQFANIGANIGLTNADFYVT